MGICFGSVPCESPEPLRAAPEPIGETPITPHSDVRGHVYVANLLTRINKLRGYVIIPLGSCESCQTQDRFLARSESDNVNFHVQCPCRMFPPVRHPQ